MLLIFIMFLLLAIDSYKNEHYKEYKFFETVGFIFMAITLISATFKLWEMLVK